MNTQTKSLREMPLLPLLALAQQPEGERVGKAMTCIAEGKIHRRRDGSIDTSYYANRAADLRRAAIRDNPGRWIKGLWVWIRAQRSQALPVPRLTTS